MRQCHHVKSKMIFVKKVIFFTFTRLIKTNMNRLIIIACLFSLFACKSSRNEGEYIEKNGETFYTGTKTNHIVYQVNNEPTSLAMHEPVTGLSQDVFLLTHQYLYNNTLNDELVPMLAKGPMEVSADGLTYTMEVNPKAVWNDGAPITAKDVLFSMKLTMFPLIQSPSFIGNFDYFKEFRFDLSNERKFQVVMKSYYMFNHLFMSNFKIVDKRHYDPKNILDAYSIEQLMTMGANAEKDAKLMAFVNEYKDNKYGHDPAFIKGNGPYELVVWEKGQKLVLKRNEKFWAKGLNVSRYTSQYPDSITFLVQKENLEQAVQQELVDVTFLISGPTFLKLQKDSLVKKNYNFYTAIRATQTFIALNQNADGVKRNKILQDVNVRKALAYLCPIDAIIEQNLQGFGKRIAGPVTITSKQYNDKLKPIPFDVKKADSLLRASGWVDANQDGVLEKVINGKKQDLAIELMYSANNKNLEPLVLRVKSEWEKSGIKVKLSPIEQKQLVQNIQKYDYDAAFSAVSPTSSAYDFMGSFHSSSIGKGNHAGYKNPKADLMIEKIRTTQNPALFKQLSDSLQAMIYNDQPLIYFYTPMGRKIVHRRLNGGDKLVITEPLLNSLEMKRP